MQPEPRPQCGASRVFGCSSVSLNAAARQEVAVFRELAARGNRTVKEGENVKYLGVLCFVLATGLATGVASATDQGLLNLVMPDAKVVLGIEVDQARVSPFGQYMLSRVQTEDANLQKLINDTGFDPRKNLSEVVVATNGPHQGADSGLVLARGSFDVARIGTAAQAHGATVSSFSGVPIIAHSNENRNHAIAFPDSSTAIMGNLATVQDAITRMKTGAGLSQQSLAMVQTASAGNDLWFVTLAPLSQFAGSLPDEGVGNAMKGSNLFQKVQQASGGVKFGD